MLLLLALLHPAPAASEAREAARAAEVVRLRDEMDRLAARGVWVGVERAYEQMVDAQADLRASDHVLAAQAALTLGDVGSARDRLASALALADEPRLRDWLDQIDEHFVAVEIAGQGELQLLRGMTRPDALAAFRFAREEIGRTGVFRGMLAYGTYTIDGRTLVLAGPGERIGGP